MLLKRGQAGFVEMRLDDGSRLVARFRRDEHGRWRPHEMWFDAGGVPFSPSLLRDLPLRWLESEVNRLEQDPNDSGFLERYLDPPDPPSFAAVADRVFPSGTWGMDPPPRRKRRPRLTMPERIDDVFLRDLVAAYRDYVEQRKRPAPSIAEEIGDVSVRTVHGWIRKARERGLLPAGTRGAAG